MKRTQHHQTMYAIILAFIMLCSCLIIPASTTVEAASNKKLKVTSAKTVVVGKTIKIKTNVKAKFKSSNKKIATVSSNGVVKGKKAGKVKITVTSKSNKKQKKVIKITVKKKQQTIVTTEKPTTEQPSVVKPTTEASTTEALTTEKTTTEATTTETPTTEEPTPDEKPYLIAEYPGGIVARNYFFMDDEDGSFYIDKYCLNIYLVNGNEKKQISPSFVTDSNYTSETIDNVTYYTCTLSYKNYSGKYTFQVTDETIDIDIIILNVYTSKEIYSSLTAGVLPDLSQLVFYLGYKNGDAKKIDVDDTTCTILADKVYSDGLQSVYVRYDYKYNYNGTTIIVPFYDWVSPIDN